MPVTSREGRRDRASRREKEGKGKRESLCLTLTHTSAYSYYGWLPSTHGGLFLTPEPFSLLSIPNEELSCVCFFTIPSLPFSAWDLMARSGAGEKKTRRVGEILCKPPSPPRTSNEVGHLGKMRPAAGFAPCEVNGMKWVEGANMEILIGVRGGENLYADVSSGRHFLNNWTFFYPRPSSRLGNCHA